MADLAFYRDMYGISTETEAFEKFLGTIQNYYDTDYYVNWKKVYTNVKVYEKEFALLSTLCNKPDKQAAARELLLEYPQVIPALPILISCRGTVELVEDVEKVRTTSYEFTYMKGRLLAEAEAERYSSFIVKSGLIELLDHIKSVSDYATGVEVGMDTNGRKNRSGDCCIRAIAPWVAHAEKNIPSLRVKSEADYAYLVRQGFSVPDWFEGLKWDMVFWLEADYTSLVVAEVNHYGSSGSKPSAIAREYAARQQSLDQAGIGFIWLTDGVGWHSMKNPLREAFAAIPYIINVKLSSEGQLEAAIRALLKV